MGERGRMPRTADEYGVAEAEGRRDATEYRILQRVQGAPRIEFPRREREVLPVRFSLSLVDDIDARASGVAFAIRHLALPILLRDGPEE